MAKKKTYLHYVGRSETGEKIQMGKKNSNEAHSL